eukprot:gnl/Ergobibamus_cyprinoides/2087.p1 GENE.gnl/Ergobibamus_cyprinoides/2087~~gnl/Ergobibamus_cyprinoides/2087.p1  ORF type:complete len:183 (+),score=56.31 gnl/Ergobibamus_cyprinoides/2087:333-881(+)
MKVAGVLARAAVIGRRAARGIAQADQRYGVSELVTTGAKKTASAVVTGAKTAGAVAAQAAHTADEKLHVSDKARDLDAKAQLSTKARSAASVVKRGATSAATTMAAGTRTVVSKAASTAVVAQTVSAVKDISSETRVAADELDPELAADYGALKQQHADRRAARRIPREADQAPLVAPEDLE